LIFIDNLIFILLVLLPGVMIVNIIHAHVPGSRRTRTQIEEIAYLSCYGLLAVGISTLITRAYGIKFASLSEFLGKLQSIDFLFKYVSLILCVTIIIGKMLSSQSFIANKMKLVNSLRKRAGKCKVSEYTTAWDEIFENPNYPFDIGMVAQIIKNSEIISQGEIAFFTAPYAGAAQIKLVNTDTVKNYFLHDSKCIDFEEKFFASPIYEFYDIDKDLLIKFYDCKKYANYCKHTISSVEVGGSIE
jgi:hypothetical protein